MSKIFIICLVIGCLIISAGCSSTGVVSKQTNGVKLSKTFAPPPVLTIKYFTTANCPLCQQTDVFLDELSKKYPGQLKITQLGLTNADNRAMYATYVGNAKIKVLPFIVVNEKKLLVNYTQIINHLEPMLKGEEFV